MTYTRRWLIGAMVLAVMLGGMIPLFYSPQAEAASSTPTFIQSASSTTGCISPKVTSIQKAFVSNTNASDTILVGLYIGGTNKSPTVTDSRGNTFTQAAKISQTTDGHEIFVYYAQGIKGGADTVTAAWSGSVPCNALHLFEFSGLSSTGSFDKSSTATGRGTVANSGATPTTSQANELIFGFFGESGAGTTITTGGGYTRGMLVQYGGTNNSFSEYRIVSSTAAYVATDTSNGTENWSAIVATFKAASSTSDITPPSVKITSPASGASVSSTVTLTASSTDNVAVASVAFYEGLSGTSFASSTFVGSTSAASGTLYSVSWNTTSLADGSTTLWALATDTSNNTSTASTTVNVKNPAVLSVTTSTSLTYNAMQGSTATSSQSVTVKNTGPAGSTLNWSASSTQPWLTVTPSSGSLGSNASAAVLFVVNPSGLGTGTYTATATIADPNASGSPRTLSVTLTINATGIGVSITSPVNGTTVTSTISVTANPTSTAGIASLQFFLDGSPLGSLLTASPYTISWNTLTASNGSHILTASTTDASNNVATSSPVTITVANGDTTPPTVPTNLAVTGTTTSTVSLSWSPSTDNVGVAGYQVFRNSTQVATTTATVFTDTGLNQNTSYIYTVTAFDAAGNISAPSSPVNGVTLSADTTPPSIAILVPSNNVTVSSTITISGTASDNVAVASVKIAIDGGAYTAAVGTSTWNYSLNTTNLTNATHTITAEAIDPSGNIGTTTITVTVSNASQTPAPFHLVQSSGTPPVVGGPTFLKYGTNPVLGDLLVGVAAWFPTSTASSNNLTCSDSAGNSWKSAVYGADVPNTQSLGICWTIATQSVTSDTVTYSGVNTNLPGVGNIFVLNLYEFSGNATTSVLDVTSTNQNTCSGTNCATSGSKTTTANGDLVFGSNIPDENGVTPTPGTGFTLGAWAGDEYMTQATAGNIAATWTLPSSDHYVALMATFKAAIITSGGGGDTTPPSVPTNLAVTGTTTSTVSLSWSPSTDNVGVAGYTVFRNGTQVATTTNTYFTDTNLASSTTYTYTVSAYDAAGNQSAQSSGVSATTLGTSGAIGVNWSNIDQTIDGFGGSSADFVASLTPAEANFFFSSSTGIGLSLLRTQIVPDMGSCNAYFGTGQCSNSSNQMILNGELAIAQEAVSYGVTVWSTPWSPPAQEKSNDSLVSGGSLLPADYPTWAASMAGYVNMMASSGVPIYAVSVQNEPDLSEPYLSANYSAQQMHDFIPYLYSALQAAGDGSTQILMPEESGWKFDLATTAMNDPSVASDVGILAAHAYSGTIVAPTNYGKHVWMSEVSSESQTYDGSMSDGMSWAETINQYLTVANINAWNWWFLSDMPGLGDGTDNSALTDINGNYPKRTYVTGQWSKFVRPGYVRIGTTGSENGVDISAFKNPTSGAFAIVVINENGTPTPFSAALNGFGSVSSVTPWITDATDSLAEYSPLSVVNSSINYTLPATSVVTFVSQ